MTEIKTESLDPCRTRVTVEVPAARVREEFERDMDRLGRSASIPGFRPGKAPRKVVELHFGGRVRDDLKERLVEESFAEALKRKGIDAAVAPRIDMKALPLDPGQPFRFAVEVEVWPEVSPGGYTGIRIAKKRVEVKDEEVEAYLRAVRDRHAEFAPVEDRGLQEGDFALCDLRGTVGGEAFDEKKGAWLETGPDAYAAGFCAKLYGMRPGERREFPLVLPAEGVREEIRGREASFSVSLREIKQKRVPELTDEFCRGLGNYADAAEFRRAVRGDLMEYAEAEARQDLLRQLNDYLLEHQKVPLPPTRVTLDAISLAERTAARLLSQGMQKEEILERKEELMATARKEAERNLALACLYGGIARREKIAASPAEVAARVDEIAGRVKKDPAEVRASLEKEGRLGEIEEEIVRRKVAAFLLEKAKVKEAKD